MKRRVILALVVFGVFLLIFSILPVYAEDNFSSLQYDFIQDMRISPEELKGTMLTPEELAEFQSEELNTITSRVYRKGNKFRMETRIENALDGEGGSIVLSNGKECYMYYPERNIAIVMPSEEKINELRNLFFGSTPNPEDYNKKYIGEETYDGRVCDVYEYSLEGKEPVKAWVAKDIDMGVKFEKKDFKIYVKNIMLNEPLDDSLFELPQGVKVEEGLR